MKASDTITLKRPGRRWDDGLPLGNGRLGLMAPGKVNEETIVVNEETLWYGPARIRRNPDGREHIGEIRRLLMEGSVEKASFLAKMALTSTPKYNNPYQPAGDLRLCFMGHNAPAQEYRRCLLLPEGAALVEYTMNGVRYRREMFVSLAYQVGVIRLTADRKGAITVSANMSRKPFEEHTGRLDEKTVGNWGENGVGGVRYFTGVRMTADAPVHTMGDFVYTERASEVILYLDTETDFTEYDGRRQTFREDCLTRLDKAEAAGFEEIRKRHREDYRQLYGRMDLTLNEEKEYSDMGAEELLGMAPAELPDTGEMLADLKEGRDQWLTPLTLLLFRYARYLLISSSTNCLLPANLQGLWNGSYEPPWQCEFTININEEMNYWFAEKSGLSECHLPLFRLLKRMAANGRDTAKELYGCEGFVAHHNTTLWANTEPEGIFDASPFWVMGGAWLALHLYEHYLYTMDTEFLKEEALPVMREAIRFFEGYLYEDEDGQLLTGPVVSPENTYRSQTGEKGALCMAPAMDGTILRQLIRWYLEGAKKAGITLPDSERQTLTRIAKKLPPLRISKDGRLMEWFRDYEETEPGHRHVSHLFGLHPGIEITKDTPELFAAAGKTLDYRISHGGGHTGWSRAWVTCFYARLLRGGEVGQSVRELLTRSVQDNMLDVHPPFQIDGNFGIAEAILEALIQSHAGYIHILPALPPEWKDGSVRGIRLRGGLTADMSWKNHMLEECFVTALKDCEAEFVYGEEKKKKALRAGERTAVRF